VRDITTACGADNGIGEFVVSGLVTRSTATIALARNHQWVTEARVGAQVVSYAGSTLMVAPGSICESVKQIVGASTDWGLQVPTALVVRADDMQMWKDYCWLMAQLGISRAAFVSHADARCWAQAQAALWAAQEQHRQRELSRR
jgi:hypothetical protein